MANPGWIFGEIDTGSCKEIPMIQDATNTYFGYVNGSLGYIVLAVGLTAIIIGIFGKNLMKSVPGWLAGVVIAGLAIGALPALLDAFGINIGCGDNSVVENEPIPAPAENAAVPLGTEIVVVIDGVPQNTR